MADEENQENTDPKEGGEDAGDGASKSSEPGPESGEEKPQEEGAENKEANEKEEKSAPSGSDESGDAGGDGDAEEKPEEKKKKKKKGPPKKGLARKIYFFKEGVVYLFKGVASPDKKTRHATIFFFICIGLAGFLTFEKMMLHKKKNQQVILDPDQAAKNISKLIEKEEEKAFAKHATLDLGKFLAELEEDPANPPPKGILNVVEFQIVIQCKEKQACDYIDKQRDHVRDQINNVLIALKRNELMTIEGKSHIKDRILGVINSWLPDGLEVTKVFFVKLVIG